MTSLENESRLWRRLYQLGGLAALGAVLVGALEIAITFLPGGNVPRETVLEWFALFQTNGFMGLRNLGLLNLILEALALLVFFAVSAAHRQTRVEPYAALALLVALLGIGVYYATNRAFPMLALSRQYGAAATEAERAAIEAAGKALLVVGQSHTPGTFLGFALIEAAAVMLAGVMLRGQVFSPVSAYAGLLGFGLMLVFEFFSAFVTGLSNVTLTLAMVGGLASMVWYGLTARRLFQLGQLPGAPASK